MKLNAGTPILLFILFLSTACQKPQDLQKPNIILIMTDDQGWGDIRSHGNNLIDTPNLDALAAAGTRFDRFYVSPVCAPTRASLLTGRYDQRTGVHGVTRTRETMREEEMTIAELLKKNGYATGCFGKWHNGAHYPHSPNGQGFDEFFGFSAGHWNNYFDTTLEHNGELVQTEGYVADVFTDAAIDFIEKNKSQPFFCYVPYNTPHSPFQAPDKYFDKYKARGLDDLTASAYAMCENIDDNVGRILRKLDETGLTENTIVIFLTDNGPNSDRFNGGMRGRKAHAHEGGVRVPFFIKWPGQIPAGKTVEKIAAHIDVLPTLAEITGSETPDNFLLDGKSLVPLIQGGDADWPDRTIFTQWQNRGGLRTQTHRLYVNDDGVSLFDMINDPGQKNDLSQNEVELTRELKDAYDDWLVEVGEGEKSRIPTQIGHAENPLVILPAHEAELHKDNGGGISYNDRWGWANDWATNWTRERAWLEWPVKFVASGEYEILLEYACAPENAGARFSIEAGGEKLQTEIDQAFLQDQIPSPDRVPRGEVYEKTWGKHLAGKLKLPAGITALQIRPLLKVGERLPDLKAVHIRKI